MTDRRSSISVLSTTSHGKSAGRSSSRYSGFFNALMESWSFAPFPDVSTSMDKSDPVELDTRRKSDVLPLGRPRTSESTNAWTRYGENEREKGAKDNGFALRSTGWWKEQMLVDRSLRSMAALTSFFALIMTIVCVVYLPDLVGRHTGTSTSVGSKIGKSCESLEATNVFLHLLINVAATMILGMSNTYQQLVTSLRFDEIRWVLSKHGDSRVGTNSPMNINHKKKGKTKAWLSWLLLISTSLPIHLLANSVFGQSIFLTTPSIKYQAVNRLSTSVSESYAWICWAAFRTGDFPTMDDILDATGETNNDAIFRYYYGASTLLINFDETECKQYMKTTTLNELDHSQVSDSTGNCSLSCLSQGFDPKCRISVRMSAALTLTVCLIIKAFYMIIVNVASRHSVKSQCLTFGDVIVASSSDPESRIYNECMVNAGEGYRHKVAHTCHKHCKSSEPSTTGDGIGHCQKCTKYNTKDKAANLVHPSIAIKFKQSLLSGLGSAALIQMIILMLCSVSMLVASILLAYGFGASAVDFDRQCEYDSASCTNPGKAEYLKLHYGTFGGFNSSAYVPGMDYMKNEGTAFLLANAAQVLYSGIYLLLTYNLTLISMEMDWGYLETTRKRLRCTLVRGAGFKQSYTLQLPKKILLPMMIFSSVMHWLLGQAISARETVYSEDRTDSRRVEQSVYSIVYGTYSIWCSTVFMMIMTGVCWWAFTYTREGFMPTMYGSIRACCAAATELEAFPAEGIQWGDLGEGDKFRHAGFSETNVEPIVPGELYCGRNSSSRDKDYLLEELSDDYETCRRTQRSRKVNQYKKL